jgi:hypothetical protein
VQDLPETRHVGIEGGTRRGRRTFPPHTVDQPISGDDLVRVEEEDGKRRSLLRTTERKNPTFAPNLQRSQNEESHGASHS